MATTHKAALSKERLLEVDPAERRLFLALGHVANEINVLHKQILWSAGFDEQPDVVSKAQVGLCFTFVRLLAGKLHEGGKILKTGFLAAKLGEPYAPLLNSEASDALKYLKRYFSGPQGVGLVRNDFAFHYSPEKLDAALQVADEPLELFVSSHHGNSMFYACEVVANRAMLESLGGGPHDVVLGRLIREVLEVGRRFMAFATGFMAAFLQRHPNLWSGTAESIELQSLTPLLEVKLPWFTDNSAVEASSGAPRRPREARAGSEPEKK